MNAPITPKEKEAVELVCIGKSDEEMGLILGVSPTAAKGRVQSAMFKLDVHKRTHLVAKYLAPEKFKK